MHVIDHEPQAWFLFAEGDALLLDVNCNHGPAGYCIMVRLDAEEGSEYSHKGHAYLNRLAQAVQDSGPGGGYQQRDLSALYSEKSGAAVAEWRGAETNGGQPIPDEIIMSDEISCPKCAQMMKRGFIPEISHGTFVSFWVEGEPEHSFWSAGIKIPADKVINIVTYRCAGCGFLESYARK